MKINWCQFLYFLWIFLPLHGCMVWMELVVMQVIRIRSAFLLTVWKIVKISISHFVCLKFFYLIWVKFLWKCREIDSFGSLKISIHVSAPISHKKTHKIKITPTEKPSNANKIHQFYVFTPNFAPLQIKIKFKSRSRKQISISNNHNSANKHVSGPKKYHFLLKLEKDTTLWSESN